MEEKVRPYGTYMTWKEEQEMYRQVKEIRESGLGQIALERGEKWLKEHPELEKKMDFPYKPILL